MKRIFFAASFLITSLILTAQVVVNFEPVFNDQKLQTEAYYKLANGDSVAITNFRWYISAISLKLNDSVVFSEANSFHLLNLENKQSLTISLNTAKKTEFNKITFSLGVDSTTSVSGVFGGDLDPANGMFWTWQSGYINFKMEGRSNRVMEPSKEFFYHLGGYSFPNNTHRIITLDTDRQKQITIGFSVNNFLTAADLSKSHSIMIPGKEAMRLTDIATRSFTIKK